MGGYRVGKQSATDIMSDGTRIEPSRRKRLPSRPCPVVPVANCPRRLRRPHAGPQSYSRTASHCGIRNCSPVSASVIASHRTRIAMPVSISSGSAFRQLPTMRTAG